MSHLRFYYVMERNAVSSLGNYAIYDKSLGSEIPIAIAHDSHYAGKIVEALNFMETLDMKKDAYGQDSEV